MGPYPDGVLKLYRIPFSTNVERVALALAHKGVPVEYVDVDSDDRSRVVEVSGQELVPVLVDGDRVISDSPAILDYLEERFPERSLYPVEEPRRAEVRIFVEWFNHVWKRPPNLIVAEEEKPEPDRARIAELERRIADALPLFEAMLAGRPFLFGDELTLADVVAFPFLKYAVIWEEGDEHRFHEILRDAMPLGDRSPRLEAWIRRMDELPRA
ncbi:MAG TPA: glutathione S-transferase family protein [Gaiellaceae bacterium]|nr:glutathione S-transferase family protein [Gaiellaceae bacterium]